MSRWTNINLANLPFPDVVETLSYETLLAAMKADLIALAPELEDVLALESEPATKILEVVAYRDLILRARVNDGAKAVTLAYATGADLDNLAAIFGVGRLILSPADETAVPPVSAVLEEDDALRLRVQLSLEAQSTAGPEGAYRFWALQADADVKDVDVYGPPETPGIVQVSVLSRSGDGVPSAEVLAAVETALNDEDVRPLTDQVVVQAAEIISYDIAAHLHIFPGPDSAIVVQAAQDAVTNYVSDQNQMGRDITLSGLYAALHQAGVKNVDLSTPSADVIVERHQASLVDTITLTHEVSDD